MFFFGFYGDVLFSNDQMNDPNIKRRMNINNNTNIYVLNGYRLPICQNERFAETAPKITTITTNNNRKS